MPTLNVNITVAAALNGLEALADLRAVESYKELAETDCFEADALVSTDDCIDVAENEGYIEAEGYVDVDDLHPNLRDLSDGLRALLDGDKRLAVAMLSRALHEWPDAARTIEDVLLARTHRDRRQASLALAA